MKYQIQGLRKSHSVLFGIKSDCNVLRLVCFVQQKKKKKELSPPSGQWGHCTTELTFLQNR